MAPPPFDHVYAMVLISQSLRASPKQVLTILCIEELGLGLQYLMRNCLLHDIVQSVMFVKGCFPLDVSPLTCIC